MESIKKPESIYYQKIGYIFMKLLITFPGQGSQSANMLNELPESMSNLREQYLNSLASTDIDLCDIIKNTREILNQTHITQPAILGHSMTVFTHFEDKLKGKDIVLAGHSLGELTAACISMGLSLAESLELAKKRASLMQKSMVVNDIETATIALLGQFNDNVKDLLKMYNKVWAINYNTSAQTVLTGAIDQVTTLTKELSNLSSTKRVVPISVSSHCPLLENILPQWQLVLKEAFKGRTPLYPVCSNTTTKQHRTCEEIIDNLTYQLTQPVLYHKMISNNNSVDAILELGPGKILTNLHKRIVDNVKLGTSIDMNSIDAILT